MKFQVFENGVPADSEHCDINPNLGWDNSIYNSLTAANAYAYLWCNRFQSMDTALQAAMSKQIPIIPTWTPTDLSHNEYPVMMEIREVE